MKSVSNVSSHTRTGTNCTRNLHTVSEFTAVPIVHSTFIDIASICKTHTAYIQKVFDNSRLKFGEWIKDVHVYMISYHVHVNIITR